LAERLAEVTGLLEPAEAARVWAEVVRPHFQDFPPDFLERSLTVAPRSLRRRRAVAVAAAVGLSAPGPMPGLALLPAVSEALPCRLSTQELVDLLKMPTCIRHFGRVVLDHLGNRYRRRFDTHWDFVRYAQEQGLDLDFTTPPKRPERKVPPLFER
jgi:hypothetical protein